MEQVIVQAWWWIQANWPTVLAYLVTSGVITTVIQYIKKKLDIQSTRKIVAMLSAFSLVPDAVNTLASNPSWAAALPSSFSWVFTGAVALHAFLVSPLWRKTAAALRPYLQAVEEVKARGNAALPNPNNALNASTETPQPEQPPEVPPLVIQG